MRKTLFVLFVTLLLLVASSFTYSDLSAIKLDTSGFEGEIESAEAHIVYEDGTDLLYDLMTRGKSGKYMVNGRALGKGGYVDYFVINGIECYYGYQLEIIKEGRNYLECRLVTLRERFTVTIDLISSFDGLIQSTETQYVMEGEVAQFAGGPPEGAPGAASIAYAECSDADDYLINFGDPASAGAHTEVSGNLSMTVYPNPITLPNYDEWQVDVNGADSDVTIEVQYW